MSILTYRKGWSNKPPVGAQLNWGHPLMRGLVAAFLCNEGAGLVLNDMTFRNPGPMTNIPSSGQGGAWQNIPGRPGITGTAANFRNNFPGGPATCLNLYNNPPAVSIATQFYARSDQGHFNGVVQWGSNGPTNGAVGLEFDFNNLSAGISCSMAIPGDARFVTYGAPGDFSQINTHVVFVVDPGGTLGPQGLTLYVNGIWVGFTLVTAPIDWVDSVTPNIVLGNGANGDIGQVLLYNRALTAGEAQMLYVDPYCIVSPQSGRVRSSGLPIPVMPPLIGNLLMPPRPHALVRM